MSEMSVKEKVFLAFDLSLGLCEPLNDGILILPDEEDVDMVWVHADGLRAKYLEDRFYGRCSLQMSMDFDMDWEEQRLDREITWMTIMNKWVNGESK